MAMNLKQLVEEVTQLKKKMQEDGQAALKDSFNEFFEKHPEASSIGWTQYTPYFNDGDACTFGVNYFTLCVHRDKMQDDVKEHIEEDAEDEDDGAERVLQEYVLNRKLLPVEQSLMNDFKELNSACQAIPEILETVFGDHVKIRATSTGFDINEYSHD